MKNALLFAVLALLPVSVPAQQPDCRYRTIPVSVVDASGAPFSGLTAANFRGEFRGAPVRVVSANLEKVPRRIVILLDLSTSMGSEFRDRAAAWIVVQVVKSLPDESRMALITFADKPVVRTNRLQDAQAVVEIMRNISRLDRNSNQGPTALWDAVAEAAHLLDPTEPGDVIYAITDGTDTASQIPEQKVEQALIDAGIRFFAMLFEVGDAGSSSRSGQWDPRQAMALAENTGGQTIVFPSTSSSRGDRFDFSPEGLKKIHARAEPLYQSMNQFYSVQIEMPGEMNKARPWKLAVLTNNDKLKGGRLHYPRMLAPCSTAKVSPPAAPK